jgi:hypothetical protein
MYRKNKDWRIEIVYFDKFEDMEKAIKEKLKENDDIVDVEIREGGIAIVYIAEIQSREKKDYLIIDK